ncbi:hypothetical protein LB465_15620 [Salegentibacter sp. LM13S]|uniref:hypothetical protein n=1 Tax=Salegentibacter lacus TaxID=2873599 RepID=UPI001CCB1905|nr:hypothetical protein [Salegentibacter lacus]MBZ9632210.1 hypothetical protein [Salegentibacter lacus]
MRNTKEIDKELSNSLKETISSSELKNIASDIGEITIDSILKDGILKDFPIIGSLTGIWKTGVAVNDYLFLRKLIAFLNESSKLSEKKRLKLIENLEQEDYQKEAGEKLIAIIDNLETKSKAILLGKALNLFGQDIITKEAFWSIAFIIEKIPMEDIRALKSWKQTDLNKVTDIRRQLYLSVGIGWFVLNASSTGFCWQERICGIFSDYLLED